MPAHRRVITVQFGDCDPAGIVYYPRYFAFMDDCTLALLAARGLALQDLFAREVGFGGLPLVSAHADFKVASRYGDVIEAESQVLEINGSRFTLRHRFSRDGRLALEGFETRVWTSVHPDDRRRLKGRPVPDEVALRLLGPAGG